MNILYISPEFPPNFQNFCKKAKNSGLKVYAIGEADFYEMPEDLRSSITYYQKTNMQNRAEVLKTVDNMKKMAQEFTLVESHNEHWIRTEAIINTTFNIPGVNEELVNLWKKKSEMKIAIKKHHLPAAPGRLVRTIKDALLFTKEHGYPVVLKPDEGVGAYNTYKIDSDDRLKEVFTNINSDYFIEAYMTGRMVTYDGLTDLNGNVVFDNSLVYGSGVLDSVQGDDTFFYSRKTIPEDLSTLGKKLVKIFNLKRKFFHFEFFETSQGLMVLEINARAPGGPILDLFNYSINDDLYQGWVDIVQGKQASFKTEKISLVAYAGRKDRKYLHTHQDIINKFGDKMIEAGANPPLFAQGMGHYKYIYRGQSEQEVLAIRDYILAI